MQHSNTRWRHRYSRRHGHSRGHVHAGRHGYGTRRWRDPRVWHSRELHHRWSARREDSRGCWDASSKVHLLKVVTWQGEWILER